MVYTLSKGYRWYKTTISESIVLMYFINDLVYTFDSIPKEIEENPEILIEATANHVYTEEEVYWASYYLIQEEVHPLIFPLELKNPNLLPIDK